MAMEPVRFMRGLIVGALLGLFVLASVSRAADDDAALLYKEKKYEESRKVSQEFLETLERQGVSSALKSSVLRQMARAMVKQGKIEEANKLVDNLLKARENDWRNLELKAWLQNETGHTE